MPCFEANLVEYVCVLGGMDPFFLGFSFRFVCQGSRVCLCIGRKRVRQQTIQQKEGNIQGFYGKPEEVGQQKSVWGWILRGGRACLRRVLCPAFNGQERMEGVDDGGGTKLA